MRCGDRACRARRDATLARSTMIRDRLVCRQFQRRQDFCEEKPCSETLIDEHGAFAVPTDAGLCGIIPFQNRPRINVTFLFTSELAKEIIDLVEFLSNHLVVIIAPRSEEHTSELQSPDHILCRLLLEKKKRWMS